MKTNALDIMRMDCQYKLKNNEPFLKAIRSTVTLDALPKGLWMEVAYF